MPNTLRDKFSAYIPFYLLRANRFFFFVHTCSVLRLYNFKGGTHQNMLVMTKPFRLNFKLVYTHTRNRKMNENFEQIIQKRNICLNIYPLFKMYMCVFVCDGQSSKFCLYFQFIYCCYFDHSSSCLKSQTNEFHSLQIDCFLHFKLPLRVFPAYFPFLYRINTQYV